MLQKTFIKKVWRVQLLERCIKIYKNLFLCKVMRTLAKIAEVNFLITLDIKHLQQSEELLFNKN